MSSSSGHESLALQVAGEVEEAETVAVDGRSAGSVGLENLVHFAPVQNRAAPQLKAPPRQARHSSGVQPATCLPANELAKRLRIHRPVAFTPAK